MKGLQICFAGIDQLPRSRIELVQDVLQRKNSVVVLLKHSANFNWDGFFCRAVLRGTKFRAFMMFVANFSCLMGFLVSGARIFDTGFAEI